MGLTTLEPLLEAAQLGVDEGHDNDAFDVFLTELAETEPEAARPSPSSTLLKNYYQIVLRRISRMKISKNVISDSAEPASENLTKEVLLHLSKEIETASNNMMAFRTRIGFGLLVGPFLLLGSLLVGAKGQPITFNLAWYGKLAFPVMIICYLGIAYIGSEIEAQAWEQNNRWRKLIARLHANPTVRIKERQMVSRRHKSRAGYLVGYSLLFISVLAAVCIVKNAGTAELQNPSGTGYVLRVESVSTPIPK